MGAVGVLRCLFLLTLGYSLCLAGVPGTEFITVFMQNSNSMSGNPELQLTITALSPDTSVTIKINKMNFRKTVTLDTGEMTTVELPSKIQMIPSVPFSHSVIVMSNNPVSVVSMNFKEESSDTASLYPVEELENVYYIVTPPEGPQGSFKEFAVVTKEPTTLTIYLTGKVTFQNRLYRKGSKLVVSLESYEAVELQSEDDLTGTMVESRKPVAVLSGHTCSWKHTKCNHVYEQLPPVSSWATTFIIPPISFQTKYDLVFVTASQNTQVTYQTGQQAETKELHAGETIQLQLKPMSPLFITSTEGIQVLLYSAGGINGTIAYDTFLMGAQDVTSFCTAYQAVGPEMFYNQAIMVAKTSSLKGITVDKKPLKDVSWQNIPGTEYSWGEFHMESNSKTYMVEDSDNPFGLFSVGIASVNAYGELATCVKGSTRPSCSHVKCRKKESCKIVRGQAKCIANSEAVCWAWGDPHYHTFDERNYDFQGTCTYTMAKTCGSDLDLPKFNIQVKNENRGSSLVSYIRHATIEVYGYEISGFRSEYGIVRVNNQKVQLPVTLHDGKLKVYQSGSSLIIVTEFGLRVLYDWNIILKIFLPSSFAENVCGLCGNYNGNPKDDLYSLQSVPLDPIEFGRLWKVEDNTSGVCWDDCNGPCKKCPAEIMQKYGQNTFCGILTQTVDGPFRLCHAYVDPKIYKENCIFDLCIYDGFQQILCQALQTYSDTCRREKAPVFQWRNITGCNVECPANSKYSFCGSACPATCEDPQASLNCTEPCIETCECEQGFVMIEGKCLPKENCGCFFEGRFYSPNQKFWADTNCKQKCVCDGKSHIVTCKNTGCRPGEECTVKDGLQDCYPTNYATCSASGDPHYITFDGVHYNFQGTCEYLLSGLCSKTRGLTDFQVRVLNQNRGSRIVSYTTAVNVTIYSTEIQIRRDYPDQVLVNGMLANLPLTLSSGQLSVFRSGRHCVIQSRHGIRVTFDWDARVAVTVPSYFAGSVCGLCGNFNHYPEDDFMDRNGILLNDTDELGKSWKVAEVPGCREVPEKVCKEINILEKEQRKSKVGCGMLLDKKGPFRMCHAIISPEDYFQDCIYDLCAFGNREDITCRLLSGYTSACQDIGAVVYPWRSDQFCNLPCPANSHYNVCSSDCPSTCLSLTSSTSCDTLCNEGCVCDDGFVLSGSQCIPLYECGCSFNGQYYKPEEIFFPVDTCEQRCTCNIGGSVVCSPFYCGPYEECRVEKGVQSCKPVGSSTCSVMGEFNYWTFDGLEYDFYGNCSYILSKSCLPEGSKLTPYLIRVRNEQLATGGMSKRKIITLDVYNHTINIYQDEEIKILVNGILRNLPFELESGKVRADHHGLGIILNIDFGLFITADVSLHVTVPGNYHNYTCGLCGNYNDNQNDDLDPNNDDVVAFADSWKDPDTDEICTTSETCTGNNSCPICPRKKQKVLAGENFCGILTTPDGPFAACHSFVNASGYLSMCVNSLCTGSGDLCLILQNYVMVCQEFGVAIKSWRTPSFCPLSCPEHSHFKSCADLCSTSCSSLYDTSSCPTFCSEGCQCDTGYFFQGGICVTPDNCGCYLNMTSYKAAVNLHSPRSQTLELVSDSLPLLPAVMETLQAALMIPESKVTPPLSMSPIPEALPMVPSSEINSAYIEVSTPAALEEDSAVEELILTPTQSKDKLKPLLCESEDVPVPSDDETSLLPESTVLSILAFLVQLWHAEFEPVTSTVSLESETTMGVCTTSVLPTTESIPVPSDDETSPLPESSVNETIIKEDCSQRCTCSSTQLMVCEPYSCAKGEVCTVLEGVVGCVNVDPCKSISCRNKETCKIQGENPVCVPDYTETCWEWGHNHYQTFDDYSFEFEGTCTYVLAKYIGNDTSLVPFSIEEQKETRGILDLSYVRMVNIFVYGYKISIMKFDYGKVMVNDAIMNTPLTLYDGRISISLSGPNAVVSTDFGLRVTYNYDYQVAITIPSSYYGTTGGLCGNFNQNSNDEKMTIDNHALISVTEWAKSWKVNEKDSFCFDVCEGNCLICDDKQIKHYSWDDSCGLLNKTDNGPFRECYPKISPEAFINNCIKDICNNDILQHLHCLALQSYATICRKEGVEIYDWRTPTKCPFLCPDENSHYEPCGSACPATCSDRTAPNRCTEPCVETCQCNEGFIQSAGKCVPITSCGCNDNGIYYQPNQEFWSDEKCSVHCKCDATLGMVVCKEDHCKASEKCMLVNGVQGCYPANYSICVASGDPHFTTFDGKKFDFMGTCIYQLVSVCSSDPSLTPFQVNLQNEDRGRKTVSYTKAVTLQVYNQTITLSKSYPLQILVNGVLTSLPFSFNTNKIKAFIRGEHAFVRTDFDVTVNFNWDSYARVMLPSTYASAVCGLCGNYNQDPNDDLPQTDGKDNFDSSLLSELWKVGEVDGCTSGCKGACPQCSEEQSLVYKSEKYCGILNKAEGPLSQCFKVIDPIPYLTDCVYDSCQYQGHYSVVCAAIAAYASQCQEKGINISQWRTPTFCNLDCPSNSHYEICGSGCLVTCAGITSPDKCEKSCTEGCYCDSGFILSGDTCVPRSQCGCVFQGFYYQNGAEFYPEEQCKKKCQCLDNGEVKCQTVTCSPQEVCKVIDGIHGCHDESEGTCTVTGNTHYMSFDGLNYNFHGTCSYTLADVCGGDLSLANFSVVIENEQIEKSNMAVTRSLTVNVYGYEITMEQETQWNVKVNNEFNVLPLILEKGKIQINQEGSSIILQTDFDLKVLFNDMYLVQITVPGAYRGAVCGLCGDFNGQSNDDFRQPSGQLATNVEEFGAAWNANLKRPNCVNVCTEKCDGCDPMRAAIFGSNKACGLLLIENGPFEECKAVVNATDYFNNCLFDMCAADGQKQTLCESLRAYATACQAAGVKIKPWRTATLCPLSCPENSHYEICTHSCDITCAGITTSGSCSNKCFEGCECDDGYMFDGAKCVTINKCGCVYNGRYLSLGSSIISPDCLESCKCETGGVVICSSHSCSDTQHCDLQKGERGCFEKQGSCSLSVQGNLTTFDNLSGPVAANNIFDFAFVCNSTHDAWFRLVVIIQSCHSDNIIDISAVHAYFPHVSIAINPSGEAWMNGQPVKLPAYISKSLSVSSTEGSIVIKDGDIMELEMLANGELTLHLNQELSGAMCGACGNFNKQKSGDLQGPGGVITANFSEFIASWRSHDYYKWSSWIQLLQTVDKATKLCHTAALTSGDLIPFDSTYPSSICFIRTNFIHSITFVIITNFW
ncbi:IgGFc-binding protein-like [Rhinophrynus dorsalis]